MILFKIVINFAAHYIFYLVETSQLNKSIRKEAVQEGLSDKLAKLLLDQL